LILNWIQMKYTRKNSVDLWEDITDLQNFSTHNKGKGVGYGALALSVQSKLRGDT